MPLVDSSSQHASPLELEIRSVLVLEDDTHLAQMLKGLLEGQAYMVTTVTNGVDGLKEILALDFDAIVCDMMMPKMPGDVFYAAVSRAKPHLCKRFVFITGHSGDPKIAAFIEKVHGLVLYKPIANDDLLQRIDEASHSSS